MVKNIVNRMRQSQHFLPIISILIFCCANMTMKALVFPPTYSSDAVGYLETAAWISGGESGVPHPERMLKPLAPLGIAGIAYFTNGDFSLAMEIEVGIMYLLLALVAYIFFFSATKRRLYGYLGAIFFVAGYPALAYGLDLYTETGAWFFYLLGLFGAWKYLETPTHRWFWVTAFSVTLGMLWKEYSVLSGILFGLVIVFHPGLSWRKKISDILLYGFVAVGILLLWQLWVYQQYHFSYLDWYRIGTAGDNTEREYTLYHIAKSLFATLLLAWAFVPIGLAKWRTFHHVTQRYLLLLLLPSFMFLLWGYVSSRLYYVVAPFALIFALEGLRAVSRNGRIPAIFVGGVIVLANYVWLFANAYFRAML